MPPNAKRKWIQVPGMRLHFYTGQYCTVLDSAGSRLSYTKNRWRCHQTCLAVSLLGQSVKRWVTDWKAGVRYPAQTLELTSLSFSFWQVKNAWSSQSTPPVQGDRSQKWMLEVRLGSLHPSHVQFRITRYILCVYWNSSTTCRSCLNYSSLSEEGRVTAALWTRLVHLWLSNDKLARCGWRTQPLDTEVSWECMRVYPKVSGLSR
jgi:hypothetical protein